jgi:hypothetical protein
MTGRIVSNFVDRFENTSGFGFATEIEQIKTGSSRPSADRH